MAVDARSDVFKGLTAMYGDGAGGFRRDTEQARAAWAFAFIGHRILSGYLSNREDLTFDAARLDDVFTRFEHDLASPVTTVTLIAGVTGLEVEGDVTLAGWGLRAPTFGELERWLNKRAWLLPFRELEVVQGLWTVRVVCEMTLEEPKSGNWEASSQAESSLERIALALRLHTGAPVRVLFLERVFHDVVGKRTADFYAQSRFEFPTTSGVLAPTDCGRVLDLCRRIDAGVNAQVVDVACRRLTEAMALRARPDDVLLDSWIGLESLLLRKDEREGLSFRVALRAATLLGQDADSREQLFRQTRASYDARSKLIHGDRISGEDGVAHETRDLLRRVVLAVLNMPEKFDPRELDERAIRWGR